MNYIFCWVLVDSECYDTRFSGLFKSIFNKSTFFITSFWWCAILDIRWMVWNFRWIVVSAFFLPQGVYVTCVFFLPQGVYVTYVYEGSPAQLAGLQVHDKLLQVFEFWLMTIKYSEMCNFSGIWFNWTLSEICRGLGLCFGISIC